MKKVLSMLMLLATLLFVCAGAVAAEDAAGQIVTPGSTLYFDDSGNGTSGTNFPGGGDAVVEIEKTVTPTGDENLFNVLLRVRTTQDVREIHSDTPDAAVMLIMDVSNSMDDCAICGRESNEHRGQLHAFRSRLTEAKEKAITFLDEFANDTGVEAGDKRYVSIVDFGSMAARRLDWVDVTDPDEMAAAKTVINGLTVAHSGTTWDSADNGGTNIEAALMLGANVWNHSAVSGIDYKYTILLSDGNPTFYVSDSQTNTTNRQAIYGTRGGGSSTNQTDVKDVGKQADRILALGSLSKLYSIIFGDVANTTPFGDWDQADPRTTSQMTVLEWMEAFSTKAYEAENAEDLFDTFNSIISQIQLGAQAWKVEDEMGPYAVFGTELSSHYNKYTFENGTLNWDIIGSNPAKISQMTVNGKNIAVLEYSLTYEVELDNLNAAYRAGTPADTNSAAQLTYAVLDETTGMWSMVKPVDFPKPQVQGYDADLKFTKVYMQDGAAVPIEGMQFRLTALDSAETGTTWGPVTATTDKEGVVTFTGIPSGHNYRLNEVNAGNLGFVDPGDIAVAVSWGAAEANGVVNGQLVNEKQAKSVTLNLSKTNAGDAAPASIPFVITGPSGYHREVVLSASNRWQMAITGLEPGTYTITEDAELEGYHVSAGATLDGQNVSVGANGSIQVNLQPKGNDSETSYAVAYTNTYTRKVGGPVHISKTFSEYAGIDGTMKPIEPASLYQGVEIEVDFINAQGQSEAVVVLNNGNTWSDTLTTLPIGEYTIQETIISGVIADHDFVRMALMVNGSPVTGNQITVAENTEITIVMDNHYQHHVGDIHVMKEIVNQDANSPAITVPSDHVYWIDVYNAVAQGNGYVKGNLATTIEIRQNVSGNWTGTSEDIPVGYYYLEEREADAALDGYTFVSGVFDAQVVYVANTSAPTYVSLTNTYDLDEAELTISKVFSGLDAAHYPDYINVNVIDNADNTVAAVVTLRPDSWKSSVTLPLGTYYLDEVTAVGADGTADVPNYGHTLSWSPSATVVLDTKGENVAAQVTNTYTKNYGKVTVSKAFDFSDAASGDQQIAEAMNLNIMFLVQQKNASGAYETVDSITLNKNTGWSRTVDLPNGTYRLIERGAMLDEDSGYTYAGLTVTVDGEEPLTLGAEAAGTTGFEIEVDGNDNTPDTVSISATNNYTRDTGIITVNKAFTNDADTNAAMQLVGKIDVLVYAGSDVVDVLTLTKDNGWTDSTGNLPVGQYTVVEVHTENAKDNQGNTLNSAFVPGYNLTYAWTDGAAVELKKGETKKTVTNTYTRMQGQIVINKRFVDLPSSLWPDEVTIDIQQNGVTVATAVLDGAPWSKTVTLPVGTYTLVETLKDEVDYEHTGIVFKVDDRGSITEKTANSVDVTVTEGTSPNVQVYVTNQYERMAGGLTISKAVVSDNPADANAEFEFAIQLNDDLNGTFSGVTFTNGNATVRVKAGHSVAINGLPAGAAYTVTETTAAGFETKSTGATGTIPNVGSVTAAFTNTRKTTGLTLKKIVENGISSDLSKEFTFEINLGADIDKTFGNTAFTDGRATVKLKHGDSIQIDGLPVGLNCTVMETREIGFDTRINGQPVTVPGNPAIMFQLGDTAYSIEFTNSRQIGGDNDPIIISKTVNSAIASDLSTLFSFDIALSDPTVSGTYQTSDANGTAGTITFDQGKASVQLAHGQSILIYGLPITVTCTVEETPVTGFSTAVNGSAGNQLTQTLASGGIVYDFVNTRSVAGDNESLTISKKVVSPLAADAEKAFTFRLTLTDTGISGTFDGVLTSGGTSTACQIQVSSGIAAFQLRDGESMTIKGLPIGVGYTVSEDAADGFASSNTGSTGMINAGVASAVEFTNTRVVGAQTLTVSKKVAGSAANVEDVFTFEVRVPGLKDGVYGDMTFAGEMATVRLKHGQKAVAKGIPVGQKYTVTEVDYGNYLPSAVVLSGELTASGAETAFVNTMDHPELPSTGDNSSLALWGTIMACAGAAMLMLRRRRED